MCANFRKLPLNGIYLSASQKGRGSNHLGRALPTNNPFFNPKKRVVCTGFTVRSVSRPKTRSKRDVRQASKTGKREPGINPDSQSAQRIPSVARLRLVRAVFRRQGGRVFEDFAFLQRPAQLVVQLRDFLVPRLGGGIRLVSGNDLHDLFHRLLQRAPVSRGAWRRDTG